jgi:hypothetical protein
VIRFSRLLTVISIAIGALLATACDEEMTEPGPEPAQFARTILPGTSLPIAPYDFTKCTPQPSDSSSARIGPSGGTLRAGRHILRVPAGALKRFVLISMKAPSDTVNYVVFGPEGLTFDPAAQPTLTMSYDNCSVTQPGPTSLEIVYTDDAMTRVLDSTVTVAADSLDRTIGARLKHFSHYVLRSKSRYAVAY